MWYNTPINAEIIKFIQSFSSPLFDKFFILATMMAEESFFMIAAVFIFWCVDKNLGYRLGFSYLSNGVINSGIKESLKVPRPIGEPGILSKYLETAGGYSFPSGHSQLAASFWTSIMARAKKGWVYVLGAFFILLVGISRLYLGVHRPIDVLAGIAVGVIWVIISNYMFDIAERTGRKYIFLIFIIPMLVLLYVLPNIELYKSSGTVLAFYLGYLIEPKYIRFEVRASMIAQILKLIIGIGIMLGIRIYVKLLLPETLLSDFFRYFLMGIWVTIIAPFIFKLLFTYKKAGKHLSTGK